MFVLSLEHFGLEHLLDAWSWTLFVCFVWLFWYFAICLVLALFYTLYSLIFNLYTYLLTPKILAPKFIGTLPMLNPQMKTTRWLRRGWVNHQYLCVLLPLPLVKMGRRACFVVIHTHVVAAAGGRFHLKVVDFISGPPLYLGAFYYYTDDSAVLYWF